MSILLGATGDVRGEEYCLLVLLSHTSNTTIIHLPFPPSSSLYSQQLMQLLSNPEVSDIATWLPHGKGFLILQKRKFALDVMPLYFKHSKFTSFTRKLNRWGFTRVSRGPEMGAYYHKVRCFLMLE